MGAGGAACGTGAGTFLDGAGLGARLELDDGDERRPILILCIALVNKLNSFSRMNKKEIVIPIYIQMV